MIRGPPGRVFQDLLNLKLPVLMLVAIYIYTYRSASVVTREEVKEGSEGNHRWRSSIETEQEACYGTLLIRRI